MKTDKLQLDRVVKDYSLDKTPDKTDDESFKKVFSNALHKVNNLQKNSDIMSEKLALGEVDNVHQVMIASQKAKLSLDLTLKIRNKVVDAYKKIMRMQV